MSISTDRDILALTHAHRTAERMGVVHRVQSVRELTSTTFVLRIERNNVPCTAGQCATLGLHGSGINREYSLYSGEQEDYFEFLIREVEGGLVSTELRRCRPGDLVDFDGPYGRFVIEQPDAPSRRYLFIGTGVGIAPYRSFVRSYPELDYTIVHGVRLVEEQYEKGSYANGRYIGCVSREEGGEFHGRVTAYLAQHPVSAETLCYLCGNNAMIAETYDLLRSQGVLGDNLFTEIFF